MQSAAKLKVYGPKFLIKEDPVHLHVKLVADQAI